MSSNTTRIAKNTLMLYFRQILIMLVSLYTVRVVLETLGAEDYGIYNIVAGVVTMFTFLNGTMAGASQRFFSFELGKGDIEQLKRIFSLNHTIYILIALLVLLLAETIGLWFTNNKLIIPPERMYAVQWIYQFSIVSFLCSIMVTPYMAAIIAHEDMNIYAYVSIIEVILKLTAVFLLPIISIDKLQLYGILQGIIAFINLVIHITIAKIKYRECIGGFYWDNKKFKEIVVYTGWNLFGWTANVCKNQGINILLNQFFNPVVVASKSIAAAINNAITSFSLNFNMALRPQIIKKYALGQFNEMLVYVFNGVKGTYFLMYLFTLPLVLEMPIILRLWLNNPPEYTVLFTRLIVIEVLINTITYPIGTMVSATGKMKLFQSISGGLQLINFPLSLIVLYFGVPAYMIFIIAILLTFVTVVVQLFMVRFLINFSIRQFYKQVLSRLIIVSIVSMILPFCLYMFFTQSFLRLCLVASISIISTCGCMYFIGLNKIEQENIKQIIIRKLLRRDYL